MIFGWDISTSIVGFASFDDDGKYITSHHLDLRKIEGLIEKSHEFDKFVRTLGLLGGGKTHHYHFVEERLGNFAAGRSMLQVLMKLAAFNATCSYIIWKNDIGSEVKHLHPSTWKSLMKKEGLIIPKGSTEKKELTLHHVVSREPNFPNEKTKKDNPQPWMYDMADAYCIGRAGYLQLCTERESLKPSELPFKTRVGLKAKKQSSSVETPPAAEEPTTKGNSQ